MRGTSDRKTVSHALFVFMPQPFIYTLTSAGERRNSFVMIDISKEQLDVLMKFVSRNADGQIVDVVI